MAETPCGNRETAGHDEQGAPVLDPHDAGARRRDLMVSRRLPLWLALLGLLALPLSAGPALGAQGRSADALEAAGPKLDALAHKHGALGTYLDGATGQFVVVVPAHGPSSFAASDVAALRVPVRVESRSIDQATIDRIEGALLALRPSLPHYAYAFYFDPVAGNIVLQSEAPESAFAMIERAFPGKIAFRPGTFATSSMSNDGPPHYGGAYLNGEKYCTSGFTLHFNNSGTNYMVTAGHCDSNGSSTNMGTVWQDSQVFPYWDFELVYGHTYAGRIYDSANYSRPVVNAWNPSIGASYCTTGRTSGIRCSWTLRSLNVTICYTSGYPSGKCAHNLAGFNQPDGTPVQPGDSGGPLWYSYSSPLRAGIRGVISGYFFDIGTLNWMSYATQYQTIADWYVAQALLGG